MQCVAEVEMGPSCGTFHHRYCICTGARLHVVRVLVSHGVTSLLFLEISCRNESSYASFPFRVSAHGALNCQNY